MYCLVWLMTLTLATTTMTRLLAADAAGVLSRRQNTTLATTGGSGTPSFSIFLLFFWLDFALLAPPS